MKIEESRYFKAYQKMMKKSGGQEIIFCLGCEKCQSDKIRQHIITVYPSGKNGESFLWIETDFIKALGFYTEHLY